MYTLCIIHIILYLNIFRWQTCVILFQRLKNVFSDLLPRAPHQGKKVSAESGLKTAKSMDAQTYTLCTLYTYHVSILYVGRTPCWPIAEKPKHDLQSYVQHYAELHNVETCYIIWFCCTYWWTWFCNPSAESWEWTKCRHNTPPRSGMVEAGHLRIISFRRWFWDVYILYLIEHAFMHACIPILGVWKEHIRFVFNESAGSRTARKRRLWDPCPMQMLAFS